MKIPYIHTNDGMSLVLNGRPHNVPADHPQFAKIERMVYDNAPASSILDVIEEAARRLQEVTRLTPDMLYKGGVIAYKGTTLHNYAADKLIDMISSGRDHAPLAKFLDKLQSNTSKRVVDNLYEFLEKGRIPLTEDGDFLAYKAVRSDYKDIHSGTFDNSIGERCTMPRNRVDEDPDRTCSAGLHVCSFDYLPHFSHADGHVMVVKVSPADVVAIPRDYNQSKMRVSSYLVIDEVKGYYGNRVDVLGNVGVTTGVMEPKYTVYDSDGDDVGSFYTLDEAKIQAQEWFSAYSDVLEFVEVADQDDMVVWAVR